MKTRHSREPIAPTRIRRISGSFSWIDHRFVPMMDGLSRNENLLYLWLVAVGDRQGVSFYSDEKTASRLKITVGEIAVARMGLLARDLVAYRDGVSQVLSFPHTEEKLKPLPQGSWTNVVVHEPKKPTKTGLIIFDTNAYSFPDYLGYQEMIVHAFVDRIELFSRDQKCVAIHARSFERNTLIINPIHRSITRLSAPAKRQRILAAMRGSDPALKRFFEAHHIVGEDHETQAIQLFDLLRKHGKTAIISAVREALRQNSPRVSSVCALLEPLAEMQTAEVTPQDQRILTINYRPRSLEEYDDDKS
jgi:hypothetical protein